MTQFKKFYRNNMSVEQQQQAPQEGTAQAQQAQAPVNAVAENEATDLKSEAKADGSVAAVEAGVAALSIPQPQAELHRACAEGRLEDVRSVLGRGLDALETLGKSINRSSVPFAAQPLRGQYLNTQLMSVPTFFQPSSRCRGCLCFSPFRHLLQHLNRP